MKILSEEEKRKRECQRNCKHDFIWSPERKDGQTLFRQICVNCGFVEKIMDAYGNEVFVN